MDDVRKDLLKNVTGYIDSEWHGEGYPIVAELIVDDFLSHPRIGVIAEDQSLPEIKGNYAWLSRKGEQKRMLDANFKRLVIEKRWRKQNSASKLSQTN